MVKHIRECLEIEATSPAEIIAVANEQLDILPHGGLLVQADAILAQF